MSIWKSAHNLPGFGLALAAFGALMITPDTLFMRYSEMTGWSMLAWRGSLMGVLLLAIWAVIQRRQLAQDWAALLRWPGLVAAVSHAIGNMFFSLAVAETAVSIVLIALASSPVFAAIFSRVLLAESTRAATWVAMIIAFIGVGYAVSSAPIEVAEGTQGSGSMVLGAGYAICAAALIGLSFVCYRKAPEMNVLLVTGTGALGAGAIGLMMTPAALLFAGQPIFISINGLFVLPVSFLALTYATRYTQAANVSLLMILETILGPLWVWLGFGERPTQEMFIGGAIVIIAIVFYTLHTARLAQPEAVKKAH